MNNLNPVFMKEIFSLKPHNYPLRTQNLVYPNPPLYLMGTRVAKYGKTSPKKFKNDISVVKSYISKHYKDHCKCKLCKQYFSNLGYIE